MTNLQSEVDQIRQERLAVETMLREIEEVAKVTERKLAASRVARWALVTQVAIGVITLAIGSITSYYNLSTIADRADQQARLQAQIDDNRKALSTLQAVAVALEAHGATANNELEVQREQTRLNAAQLDLAKKQGEPYLALNFKDGALVLENRGQGLAQQASMPDHRGKDSVVLFRHEAAIAGGKHVLVSMRIRHDGSNGEPEELQGQPLRAELTKTDEATAARPLLLCIIYADANGRWFETWQDFFYSGAPDLVGASGLTLPVRNHRPVTGGINQACRRAG